MVEGLWSTAAVLPGLKLAVLFDLLQVCGQHSCVGATISSTRLAGTDAILSIYLVQTWV